MHKPQHGLRKNKFQQIEAILPRTWPNSANRKIAAIPQHQRTADWSGSYRYTALCAIHPGRQIAALALPATRGDKVAEKSLSGVEGSKVAAQNHRQRLIAAKTAVETELAEAIAAEQAEAERVRVSEMAERVRQLRERADELDGAARVLVGVYAKFRNEASSLGLPRLRAEIVNNACRRALTGHLSGTGLALELIAPSQRHTFRSIANAWTVGLSHIRKMASPDDASQAKMEKSNV